MVWDLYGLEEYLIKEQRWESSTWWSGEPNCDKNVESAAHSWQLKNWQVNDADRSNNVCVICQIYE